MNCYFYAPNILIIIISIIFPHVRDHMDISHIPDSQSCINWLQSSTYPSAAARQK